MLSSDADAYPAIQHVDRGDHHMWRRTGRHPALEGVYRRSRLGESYARGQHIDLAETCPWHIRLHPVTSCESSR